MSLSVYAANCSIITHRDQIAREEHGSLCGFESRCQNVTIALSPLAAGTRRPGNVPKDGGSNIGSELRDALHALRAVCLRSFPEMLADIKAAAMVPPTQDIGTGILDVLVTVSPLVVPSLFLQLTR